MTDAVTEPREHIPLGVGDIIAESFSILFRNIPAVVLLCFVPTFLGFLIPYLFLLPQGFGEPSIPGLPTVWAIIIEAILQIVVYGLAMALVVQLAYDSKLGRAIKIADYFGPAFRVILPVAIVSTIVGILVALASMVLVIPGLWLLAVFAVVTPVIVIEGGWFGAMGRSASLTKEYRWPIVGASIVIYICIFALAFLGEYLAGTLMSGPSGITLWSVIVSSVTGTISTGLGAIMYSLIYARLREIKEGVSVDQIAAVFD